MKKKCLFTKRDLVLAMVFLVVAGVLFVVMKVSGVNGTNAVVYEDQTEIARYELSKNGAYRIQTDGGVNVLVIDDGNAYVTEADCPDGVCIRTGKIDKSGETIVCLPHKLVIQIEE